jgi:hypothetical protein
MIHSSSAFSFANGTKPQVNFFHTFFWYEKLQNLKDCLFRVRSGAWARPEGAEAESRTRAARAVAERVLPRCP